MKVSETKTEFDWIPAIKLIAETPEEETIIKKLWDDNGNLDMSVSWSSRGTLDLEKRDDGSIVLIVSRRV